MDHAALDGGGSGVAVSQFEAALNRLAEERLAVAEVRRQVLEDRELAASDPGHRRDLLAQTRAELAQLDAALDLLRQVQAGTVTVCEAAADGAEVDRPDPPRRWRDTGLVKRAPLGAWQAWERGGNE